MREELLIIAGGSWLECRSNTCPHQKDCANHTSAGDFRTEDGSTPQIIRVFNELEKGVPRYYCCQVTIRNNRGSVCINKKDIFPPGLVVYRGSFTGEAEYESYTPIDSKD